MQTDPIILQDSISKAPPKTKANPKITPPVNNIPAAKVTG